MGGKKKDSPLPKDAVLEGDYIHSNFDNIDEI
jgi:hypothetical protein